MEIFIHGHGGFHPKDGYTRVPKGFKLSFYTHFAKNLTGETVYDVLRAGGDAVPFLTLSEYQAVPNLSCASLTADQRQRAEMAKYQGDRRGRKAMFIPTNRIMLSQILEGLSRQMGADLMRHNSSQRLEQARERATRTAAEQSGTPDSMSWIHCHWLGCQTLQLRKAGGASLGVNASDLRLSLQNPDMYKIKWTDGNGIKHKKLIQISGFHT